MALLHRAAAEDGRQVSVEAALAEGAFAALTAGDRARHDRLVRELAGDLSGRVDVLVAHRRRPRRPWSWPGSPCRS